MIVLVSSDCYKTLKIAKKYNFYHGYRRRNICLKINQILSKPHFMHEVIEKNKNCEIDNIILYNQHRLSEGIVKL